MQRSNTEQTAYQLPAATHEAPVEHRLPVKVYQFNPLATLLLCICNKVVIIQRNYYGYSLKLPLHDSLANSLKYR